MPYQIVRFVPGTNFERWHPVETELFDSAQAASLKFDHVLAETPIELQEGLACIYVNERGGQRSS